MDHINNELSTFSILVGEFKARCSKLCNNDITNANGCSLDTLTLSAGHKQIISKSTHTVNYSFSCSDLVFCNNLNIISNYGVYFSVFKKCHYIIISRKINNRIPFPSTYVGEVWDYSKANVKTMQKDF